jgi:hypothetical protein
MVSAPARFNKFVGLDGIVVNMRNAVPLFALLAAPARPFGEIPEAPILMSIMKK